MTHPTHTGSVLEFDWSGCQLTDRGSVDEIQALIGGEGHYLGRPGIVEAIWLTEGQTPWPGPPFPRPVYRVRWRPADAERPCSMCHGEGYVGTGYSTSFADASDAMECPRCEGTGGEPNA